MAQKPTTTTTQPALTIDPQTGELTDLMDGDEWRKANAAILEALEKIELRTDGVEEVTRARLAATTLGKGAAVTALPEGSYHVLGMISGTATGLRQEQLPDGTPTESLTGEFVAATADGKRIFKSGRLFLPNGIHNLVLEAVRKGQRPDFAMEVRSVHASNVAGWTYEFVNLLAPVMEKRELIFRKLMQERADRLNAQKAKFLEAQSAAMQIAHQPVT
jgi:hypothetical protein